MLKNVISPKVMILSGEKKCNDLPILSKLHCRNPCEVGLYIGKFIEKCAQNSAWRKVMLIISLNQEWEGAQVRRPREDMVKKMYIIRDLNIKNKKLFIQSFYHCCFKLPLPLLFPKTSRDHGDSFLSYCNTYYWVMLCGTILMTMIMKMMFYTVIMFPLGLLFLSKILISRKQSGLYINL